MVDVRILAGLTAITSLDGGRVKRRTRREYRIATVMGATICFVAALLIWTTGAGGDSSSSGAPIVPIGDQSGFDPTNLTNLTRRTAAATLPKAGPVAATAQDVTPGAVVAVGPPVGEASGSPVTIVEQPTSQAADTLPADQQPANPVNRAPATSWDNSSPAGQAARAGRTGAPVGGGGAFPEGAPSSAGASPASTLRNTADEQPLAGPLGVSRQGLSDSAWVSGPWASAARTENHAPVSSPAPPFAGLSGSAPAFSPSGPLASLSGDLSSASAGASFLPPDTTESTLSGSAPSILADTAPVSVPEPTSFVLFGAGLAFLARRLKRRERGAA